jgi:ABC-type nitrate/sulfonate/bicarbonate transport system ATPase subunit
MGVGFLPEFDAGTCDRVLLACDECAVAYGCSPPVLEGINLRLRRGDRLAILGPSGAGKSTLLRLLGGLLSPASGITKRAVSKVGFVFQVSGLLPWLDCENNILVPLRLLGIKGREARERAAGALERVGLLRERGSFPLRLSVGMAKRIELARLFAAADLVSLWLLDEPFESVDLPSRVSLQQLLLAEAVRWEPGMVLVTHNREEALLLGTRFGVLHRGAGCKSFTLRYIGKEDLFGADADGLAELFFAERSSCDGRRG